MTTFITILPGAETPAQRFQAMRDLAHCAEAAVAELDAIIDGALTAHPGSGPTLMRYHEAADALLREVLDAERAGVLS